MKFKSYAFKEYNESRELFCILAKKSGLTHSKIVAPQNDLSGDPLSIDIAASQGAQNKKLLIIVSGTHGVEGFCGAAIQAEFLTEGVYDIISPSTDVLLIHALNPYGFSMISRTNENNVDLNRNFISFHTPPPANAPYDDVRDFLIPLKWTGPERLKADARLQEYLRNHGVRALQAAVSGGQYHDPNGLFYGGDKPEFSNIAFRETIEKYGAGKDAILCIDIHTGLGPCGHGELIYNGSCDSKQYEYAKHWFGSDITCPDLDNSASEKISGFLGDAFRDFPIQTKIAALAIEFGTVPMLQGLDALRGEAWLRQHPDAPMSLQHSIRQALKDAFYVDTDDWRYKVYSRFKDVIRTADKALSEFD